MNILSWCSVVTQTLKRTAVSIQVKFGGDAHIYFSLVKICPADRLQSSPDLKDGYTS